MEETNYTFEFGDYGETTGVRIHTSGSDVLQYKNISKGTAFTEQERRKLHLCGYLPPRVKNLKDQVVSSLKVIDDKESDLERFVYIRSLYDRNVTLCPCRHCKRYLKIFEHHLHAHRGSGLSALFVHVPKGQWDSPLPGQH